MPEYAEISVRVPAALVEKIRAAINDILAIQEQAPGQGGKIDEEEDEQRLYSIEEVFPDFQVGDILRGARSREELTQAELAARVGAKASHISEMERGKRPIGKEMAKRLGKALRVNYKVFL